MNFLSADHRGSYDTMNSSLRVRLPIKNVQHAHDLILQGSPTEVVNRADFCELGSKPIITPRLLLG